MNIHNFYITYKVLDFYIIWISQITKTFSFISTISFILSLPSLNSIAASCRDKVNSTYCWLVVSISIQVKFIEVSLHLFGEKNNFPKPYHNITLSSYLQFWARMFFSNKFLHLSDLTSKIQIYLSLMLRSNVGQIALLCSSTAPHSDSGTQVVFILQFYL